MYVLLSGWPFPCKILTRDLTDSIRWNIKGKRGFLSGMEMWVLTGLEMETKGQERGADCSKWQNDLLVCCPKLSSPILLMDTCFHCMIIIIKKTSEHQRFNMWWCHTTTIITINCITGIQPGLLRCFLQTVKQPVTDTAAKSQDDRGSLLKSEANTQKDGGWVQEGTGGETPGGSCRDGRQ